MLFAAAAPAQPPAPPEPIPDGDWRAHESMLADAIQLTTRDRFVKAGEAYFSPDGRWIIFQAVPVPERGAEPDPFYSMYVARLVRSGAGDAITGIEAPIRVSPPGSANTCGWFHPVAPGRVIFGSTIAPPKKDERPGFQVGNNRYIWSFPPEMDIVQIMVEPMFLEELERRRETAAKNGLAIDIGRDFNPGLEQVFTRAGYDAECSFSGDGRFVLYANVNPETPGEPDADIYVYDTTTREHTPVVVAKGYDGGPFFSPDGKWICYRSDRNGDDKLQIYVAELKFEGGRITGIQREHALTANEHVNWAPYWHPTGSFLVYGSSEVGHRNYEVFRVAFDAGALGREGSALPTPERVTHAPGADVLPAFSTDGAWMMWTSQRGPKRDDEQRPSSQLWVARWVGR